MPIEQINSTTGTVTYLHHDQAGSTRLLTGSTGTVTGKCTYNPYGTPTCEGTTTTPLEYDGQYTSSDTGLIYMNRPGFVGGWSFESETSAGGIRSRECQTIGRRWCCSA
jgi:hypothetical protein